MLNRVPTHRSWTLAIRTLSRPLSVPSPSVPCQTPETSWACRAPRESRMTTQARMSTVYLGLRGPPYALRFPYGVRLRFLRDLVARSSVRRPCAAQESGVRLRCDRHVRASDRREYRYFFSTGSLY